MDNNNNIESRVNTFLANGIPSEGGDNATPATPPVQFKKPRRRKALIGGILAAIVLISGLGTTLLVIRQQQQTKQEATGPVCPVNGASCLWDAASGANNYHYKITNVDTGAIISEGNTTQTSIQFTSEAGKTYTCTVNATNVCGSGASGVAQSTCPAVPTPTIPPTNTPTPTPGTCHNSCGSDSDCGQGTDGTQLKCNNGMCVNPQCTAKDNCICEITGTPTPTATPTPVPTNTPTPTFTPTPIPTETPTPTPVPTEVISTATPTTPPTSTPIPTDTPTVFIAQNTATPTTAPTQAPQDTATPTIAPTGPGDVYVNLGVVGLEVILIGALIFIAL